MHTDAENGNSGRSCAVCGTDISERPLFARYCLEHAPAKRVGLTRQQAINAKCKDCIYDPLAGGTWLAQVAACTFTDCPLFPYRPRPKGS